MTRKKTTRPGLSEHNRKLLDAQEDLSRIPARGASYAAPKFSVDDEPRAPAAEAADALILNAELVALMRRQNELLEIIVAASARLMQIAETDNRLESGARRAVDVHGLCKQVDQALTRELMVRTLITDNGPTDEHKNSGDQTLRDPGGDH